MLSEEKLKLMLSEAPDSNFSNVRITMLLFCNKKKPVSFDLDEPKLFSSWKDYEKVEKLDRPIEGLKNLMNCRQGLDNKMDLG